MRKANEKARYCSYQQSGNGEQEGSASSYHFTPFISIFSPLHIREEGASYLSCLAKGPPVFTQMCPLHIIWVHACLLTLHNVQNHFSFTSNTRSNKKLMRAVKVAIPAGDWKIKVNDFYRTVRHVLCRWHPKTVQDSTIFQTYSFPSTKKCNIF